MSAVLIVEDEAHLANGLRFNLEAEGYEVDISGDGEAALELLLAERERYDAVVLDVMLPGADGFTVAAKLREAGQFVPVLMLTARGRPEDVLRGFESGADDYLPKPFELTILLARLRGLLRRREWLQGTAKNTSQEEILASELAEAAFVFDGKTIDFAALELRVGEKSVRLTLMEAELMRYLIRHEGRIVARKQILQEVWNLHEDTDTRAIDNFIVRLRKYIEEVPSKPRHLLTVRGIGYRFIAEPTENASDE
ncbi:MAG: response regulator transcription factor [Pyrinomonadaceae bacterium]|nr:response regulator transcription factor [Pyrinomonadaceae bacterium]